MNFDEFANLSARFLVEEEEDTEVILRELKDAFRLYDKEGMLYMLRYMSRATRPKIKTKNLF